MSAQSPHHVTAPQNATSAGRRQAIALGGTQLIACADGTLYWPARQTLIVADLHFEKGSAFAMRGQMLPPYDTRETLCRLAAALAAHPVDTVIALGDSLHDIWAGGRIAPIDLTLLRSLQNGRSWVWVSGNHDPKVPGILGGTAAEQLVLDGISLCHVPSSDTQALEIAGHMHPAARLLSRGQSVRRRCFAASGTRLILPAFGAFTGGLNVMDPAFDRHLGQTSRRVWMLGSEGLYPVPLRMLIAD